MAELLPQAMPGRSCPLGIRLRFEMGRDIIAAKEKEASASPTFTFPAALTRKHLTKSNKECNVNIVRIQHVLSSLKEIAAKEKEAKSGVPQRKSQVRRKS